MAGKPTILVVNDDGIHGPGLRPLVAAMRRVGRVVVVVPHAERSADSHCLTLHKPIRVSKIERDFYTLSGSPADCARFAILEIIGSKVDLAVSGINNGLNLGEDVVYSGTVAGAMEATMLAIPSIAFSRSRSDEPRYAAATVFAQKIARMTLSRGLPDGVCLNVNFPESARKYKPATVVRLGQRVYSKDVTKRADPRGEHYYWLAGKTVKGVPSKGTDVAAIAMGHISITPLHVDNTDQPTLQNLKTWGF